MFRDFFIGFINFYKFFFIFIKTMCSFCFYLIRIIVKFFFFLVKNYFFDPIELLFLANVNRFYLADYFLIWLDRPFFILGTCIFLIIALLLLILSFKLLFLFYIHIFF